MIISNNKPLSLLIPRRIPPPPPPPPPPPSPLHPLRGNMVADSIIISATYVLYKDSPSFVLVIYQLSFAILEIQKIKCVITYDNYQL